MFDLYLNGTQLRGLGIQGRMHEQFRLDGFLYQVVGHTGDGITAVFISE